MNFLKRFSTQPCYGIVVAFIGALIITPDTVFMKLSNMDALQMMIWRGISMSGVLYLSWFIFSSHTLLQEFAILRRPQALLATLCFMLSGISFTIGIANSPVSIILFGVACAPLFAAGFSWLLLSERTPLLTFSFMLMALAGIAIAVYVPDSSGSAAETDTLIEGAFFGLSAGACVGLSFTLFRSDSRIPVLLVSGTGAFTTALAAFSYVLVVEYPVSELFRGDMLSIMISGGIILPASFFLLGYATRFTAAANVSLFMLLETVLGPLWVWLIVKEQPTNQMILGGAMVVASLAAYLIWSIRRPTGNTA